MFLHSVQEVCMTLCAVKGCENPTQCTVLTFWNDRDTDLVCVITQPKAYRLTISSAGPVSVLEKIR